MFAEETKFAYDDDGVGFGLGFKPVSCDYKIVSFELCSNEVEIFSLNETRLKRISISCIPPHANHRKHSKAAFLNGVIHWICNTV